MYTRNWIIVRSTLLMLCRYTGTLGINTRTEEFLRSFLAAADDGRGIFPHLKEGMIFLTSFFFWLDVF